MFAIDDVNLAVKPIYHHNSLDVAGVPNQTASLLLEFQAELRKAW